MEQDLHFLKTVCIGDTVTTIVEVIEILNEKKNVLRLSTQIVNQNKDLVVDGYEIVKVPKEEIGK